MNTIKLKTDIVYGQGSIDNIRNIKGKKAFIVTDKTMIETGLITELTYLLDEIKVDWTIYSDIIPDPDMKIIEAGLERIVEFSPDTLIALGGGSSMDSAKAILYFYRSLIDRLTDKDYRKDIEFIAIPTTSGTGSEVTSYSVITDRIRNVKVPIVDDSMMPDMAILDWNFTKTVPKTIAAHTGMDVLTHAIEAYVGKNRSTFTNPYALEPIKIIYENLLAIYNRQEDEETLVYRRGQVHKASTMAGIAFNNAGLGINHSLAHAVGGAFHLPHGMANAILLPYVIEFNARDEATRKKYCEIGKFLGFPDLEDEVMIVAFIESIKLLNEKLGIPSKLEDTSITEEDFKLTLQLMATKAINDFCTATNPVDVQIEDLKDIFKRAYYGK